MKSMSLNQHKNFTLLFYTLCPKMPRRLATPPDINKVLSALSPQR